MNSYFNKEEFHEWIMLYLLDTMQKDEVNEEADPIWFEFIEFLKVRETTSFIRRQKANMSVRAKTYHKFPIKAVKEASENIRILT